MLLLRTWEKPIYLISQKYPHTFPPQKITHIRIIEGYLYNCLKSLNLPKDSKSLQWHTEDRRLVGAVHDSGLGVKVGDLFPERET